MTLPTRVWAAAIGLVLVVAPLVVGAATAPAEVQPPPGDGVGIIVGVQGTATGHGYVIAYAPDGSVRWRYGNATSYHDVTVLPNGSVLAAFATHGATNCGALAPPCARTGYKIIDPTPSPHVVASWSYPVRNILGREVHDVERIAPGTYVVVGMAHERLGTVDNGSVTWWWNASEYYDAPPHPTRVDWLHMNDVDALGNDRYLVSVRNMHQLLIVKHGEGVVRVINTHRNTSKLRRQHNPQHLDDGAVLVADSSNDRVVELHRRNGTWRVAWAVGKANGVPFAWPRDADRLPSGQTLITDSRNNRVILIDTNGTVIQSWHTPALPYDADTYNGEPIGGQRLHNAAAVPATGETEVPVLGRLAIGLQHSVGLPWYLSEYHLIVMLVGGAILVVAGLVDGYVRGTRWARRRLRPADSRG